LIEIEARRLSVEYVMRRTAGRVKALDDMNFSVNSGKFVCIVGASGCGKTTLLNVLAGLQNPTSGQVLLDGEPVRGPGRERAMVFQSAALMPWRTVLRNVTYGLEIQHYSAKEAAQVARTWIDLVGLNGFEQSYPRELSGGMRQRVNLARALATNPKLLLMDEPFASLDGQMRDYMQGEIERIWRQTRQTTLFVTHLIDEAIFLADEVIVMTARPGRVKMVVPVDLPRPRTMEIKKTPAFHALEDHLRDLVAQEFKEMMRQLGNGIYI
jgi:NitT/TauT family transport system ATP-binding protein